MYLPAHFAEHDAGAMRSLIEAHPLATLIIAVDGRIIANHIPLQWRAGTGVAGVLRGHVARANPLWRELGAGCAAVAVFHGPSAYVSPAHYPSKAATGRVVPTWNYAVVHARGQLAAIDDPAWLAELVGSLTAEHEAKRAQPWAVSDAPAEFIAAQLRAIVGIELAVTELTAKFKLSQNRDAADRAGVVAGLRDDVQPSAHELVELMQNEGPPRKP